MPFDLKILLPEIYPKDVQGDLAKVARGKSAIIKYWKQPKVLPMGDQLNTICHPINDPQSFEYYRIHDISLSEKKQV